MTKEGKYEVASPQKFVPPHQQRAARAGKNSHRNSFTTNSDKTHPKHKSPWL